LALFLSNHRCHAQNMEFDIFFHGLLIRKVTSL
jgi:hypothetical protein